MLVIRLQKIGKKHTATFRVVVTEKTAGSGRQYLDLVGNVNRGTKAVSLNKEKILGWISKGAQPSPTVHNLLISQKIISGEKIPVHKISKKPTAPAEESAGTKAPAKAASETPGTGEKKEEPIPAV